MAGQEPEQIVRWPMTTSAGVTSRSSTGAAAGDHHSTLPEGLRVDERDVAAWVGLTPLTVTGFRPRRARPLSGLPTFHGTAPSQANAMATARPILESPPVISARRPYR